MRLSVVRKKPFKSLNQLPLGFFLEPLNIIKDEIIPITENKDYSYFLLYLENKSYFNFTGFSSICAFIPQINNDLKEILVNGEIIRNGSCILLNNIDLEISKKVSEGIVLIAGTKKNSTTKKKLLTINDIKDHYKVTKPWGHELWINYGQKDFSFKEVYLKSNNQTSLQYHHFKRETAILYSGKCEVIYKKDKDVTNDKVISNNLGKHIIDPISIIDIEPNISS